MNDTTIIIQSATINAVLAGLVMLAILAAVIFLNTPDLMREAARWLIARSRRIQLIREQAGKAREEAEQYAAAKMKESAA